MNETGATMVIFGGSGDLTWRKLVPSLFSLHRKKRFPEGVTVVGFGKPEMDDAAYRNHLASNAKGTASDEEWADFAERLHYMSGDFTEFEDIALLDKRLAELEAGTRANRLYYLATSPKFYETIVSHLGTAGMSASEDGWRRVVVEKPFGRDLASARDLNESDFRHGKHRDFRAVPPELFPDLVVDFLPVPLVFEIDEVDHNDAPEVPQTKLSANFPRSFKVRSERILLLFPLGSVSSAVHIHNDHSLGLLDNDIASAPEPDFGTQTGRDLLLDSK